MSDATLNWCKLGLDPDLASNRRTLIEASAGTGKTWTISMLYLRLMTERGYRAGQVVVTTFTEAAAQELRERIRGRLRWALALANASELPDHDPEDDPEVRTWLGDRWQDVSGVQAQDALRLRLALSELDLAPIGTIHGLCRKILGDQPFASASPFRLGDLTAEEDLVRELDEDLIRRCAHAPEAGAIQRVAVEEMLKKTGKARGEVTRVLALVLSSANKIVGPDLDAFNTAIADLSVHRASLLALAEREDWRKGNGDGGLPKHLRAFAAASDDHSQLALALGGLDNIAKAPNSYVQSAFKDEFEQHAGFQAVKAIAVRFANLKSSLSVLPVWMHRDQLRAWRRDRLVERNQFTFDDLIDRVHLGAVTDANSRRLVDPLFAAWPVALIDEFQDTDARQYAIFDAIYRDERGLPRGQLVMIGDPKQAIYSFRGGDIHAYLTAAGQATQRMTLTQNFRSAARVIQAMNALYEVAPHPFGSGMEHIAYEAVTPAGRADQKPLVTSAALGQGGLQFHLSENDAAAKSAGISDDQRALASCADQVMAYLQPGAARIGDSPVQPKHIAILVPTKKQVATMRDLLAERGVPCVGGGKDSVFESEWATDLRIILYALLNARDAGALRAAMATRLIGRTMLELKSMLQDLVQWKCEAERFAEWAQGWREHGVLHVVDRLVDYAAPKLLVQTDGERALTDLRHLGELLEAKSHEVSGREQLLAWLADQTGATRDGDEQSSRDRELRIESDEKRLQIMTLHSSKGLEFDIVMLPLMPKHDGKYSRTPKFGAATPSEGSQRTVDLGSVTFELHKGSLERDQNQERLRVLYVALTRARHACHVFLPETWVAPSEPKKGSKKDGPGVNESGIAHLLHGVDLRALSEAIDGIHLERNAAVSSALALPAQGGDAARHARHFDRSLPFIGSHSFSTLTHRSKTTRLDDDSAAVDELASSDFAGVPGDSDIERIAHPELVVLKDLRGAHVGNALHAIFEDRAHDVPVIDQLSLVRARMEEHGVRGRDDLASLFARRIDASLAAELGGGMRLGQIAPEVQRAEMAFHIAIPLLNLAAFGRVCADHGYPDLLPDHASRRELRGFLTGKIDLVFEHGDRVHVLDYKSNWIGDAVMDYQGESIDEAMRSHAYDFQALLYVLAVDRYLQQRKQDYSRERDLGDVIYLFVRAAGIADGAGVWRHRFPMTLIAELETLFDGGVGAHA